MKLFALYTLLLNVAFHASVMEAIVAPTMLHKILLDRRANGKLDSFRVRLMKVATEWKQKEQECFPAANTHLQLDKRGFSFGKKVAPATAYTGTSTPRTSIDLSDHEDIDRNCVKQLLTSADQYLRKLRAQNADLKNTGQIKTKEGKAMVDFVTQEIDLMEKNKEVYTEALTKAH